MTTRGEHAEVDSVMPVDSLARSLVAVGRPVGLMKDHLLALLLPHVGIGLQAADGLNGAPIATDGLARCLP
jgi:hypothetical protein